MGDLQSTQLYRQATVDGVIDIGGSKLPERLQAITFKHLNEPDQDGRYFLPDILFSNDTGLQLWHQVNHLPHYYQTDIEVKLLEEHAADIARLIPAGSSVFDLGCGDVRKVRPVLDALEKLGKDVDYYGLDLSHKTLAANMESLRSTYQFVQCFGLWGTFEDGFEWAKSISGRRLFLSLGSIYSNDRFDRAVRYLKTCVGAMRPHDLMLIGIDCSPDPDAVWASYHDSSGIFEAFIRNGFQHSNVVVGGQWYNDEDWEVRGVMEQQPPPLRHKFVLRAVRDVEHPPTALCFKAGTEIECYEGIKQTPDLMARQLSSAGLHEWRGGRSRPGQFMSISSSQT
ncbi:DUF323 domain-containing protein [Cordyceps militaris CM01]|uniref:4-dimethylallyltryptophan N-methyltransferase n=1 Tax=Cordyceps militaris (strain CM01) TaxID=983644 RepID=G3JFM3_CORMM|nr:DUF323 domain-containing protein [Cordyceps militaris CM01]EGX93597.1 DUF323 domain-containing protein [Cordyceps militaris CM01]